MTAKYLLYTIHHMAGRTVEICHHVQTPRNSSPSLFPGGLKGLSVTTPRDPQNTEIFQTGGWTYGTNTGLGLAAWVCSQVARDRCCLAISVWRRRAGTWDTIRLPHPQSNTDRAARSLEKALLHTVPPSLWATSWAHSEPCSGFPKGGRLEACGRRAEDQSRWDAKVYGRHLCAPAVDFLLYVEGTIISEVGK